MAVIKILDHGTIDQIAAGEVVERPSSVVKELVENAMDSGANAITVEIKDGGIELIRVTDNGSGIEREDIRNAFLRHATSKIRTIDDLSTIHSMGFRGEALASIASVSKVTMITKRKDDLMGLQYELEGGVEKELDEIGAPDGTTILVRQLFYNTPVRRKFLKSPSTEGSHIAELMEHLAMSRPDISYKFIQNGHTRFITNGNGNLKEVIYRIYGRDMTREVIPISFENNGITINGFLGTPANNRPNRNFENYFINQRYIRSDVISKGIEEGYRAYLMQHKFPFCVLHISIDTHEIDINVHPSKMDIRFHNQQEFFDLMRHAVEDALHSKEMIPKVELVKEDEKFESSPAPEPFETQRRLEESGENRETPLHLNATVKAVNRDIFAVDFTKDEPIVTEPEKLSEPERITEPENITTPERTANPQINSESGIKAEQLSLFEEERVISPSSRAKYHLLGQIFDTYWILTFRDALYFVDQHAAHEKVNYERLMKRVRENQVVSQQLNPPFIITLSQGEQNVLQNHLTYFERLGFEMEEFGGNEYAIRAIPLELYHNDPQEMILMMITQLSEKGNTGTPEAITQNIATMACKASVKGNMKISSDEMNELLDELLTLENPYHCPHGRPTMFSMSKTEIEKKFKRIL
ncbi:MAG TPA: DNA mismatch repair endonuclease MutL [Lachnospiraceae bacterium]|nr:DNA mismatch repair endonuclease MutL [Lachnospiraceae bacterium]